MGSGTMVRYLEKKHQQSTRAANRRPQTGSSDNEYLGPVLTVQTTVSFTDRQLRQRVPRSSPNRRPQTGSSDNEHLEPVLTVQTTVSFSNVLGKLRKVLRFSFLELGNSVLRIF